MLKVISKMLFVVTLIYLGYMIFQPTLFLNEMSQEVANPISMNWRYITIDTHVIEGHGKQDEYRIDLLPVYILLIIAFLLHLYQWIKIKKGGYE
ncbi:hypothetical protein [Macrococcoides caseolyticum]|uniref:hypothetical protein n=1 Tax=Macrococcoides caseolyticum TaxID=69966 RepID=UPI001F406A86|nr:hypothetical protein [Macrococcus caseolyticus]MCE4956820.1 hypothetical protein [Macrococcus caseolyticus]